VNRTSSKILVLDYAFGYGSSGKTVLLEAEEWYECQQLDYGFERGAVDIGFAFVWRKQQECNWRNIAPKWAREM